MNRGFFSTVTRYCSGQSIRSADNRQCALALIVVAGCAGSATTDPPTVVRDSLGITIIESRRQIWSSDNQWRVNAEFLVDVGSESTGNFFDRIENVLWLTVGTSFAVADRGARTIEAWDLDGNMMFDAGGSGGGPGEYESIDYFGRYHQDTLLVYDGRLSRATILDEQLGYVRTVNGGTAPNRALPRPLGVFPDGSILSWGPPERIDQLAGSVRPRQPLQRINVEEGSTWPLDTLMGTEGYFFEVGGFANALPSLFGRSSYVGVYGEGYFTADSERWEIELYSGSSTPLKLLRRLGAQQAVTGDQEAALKASIETDLPDNQFGRTARQHLSRMPIPELMPAFGRLSQGRLPSFIVDDREHLWVLEYRFLENTPEIWSVFDPDGTFMGSVKFPMGFTPMDFKEHLVVGVWRDELDVEHVRVYEIDRGDTGS